MNGRLLTDPDRFAQTGDQYLMSQHLGNALTMPLETVHLLESPTDGSPVRTAARFVSELNSNHVDAWGADPGDFTSETADEIFVILEGRGVITFDDTGETIEMGPGDIVRLNAGQTNYWKTYETIRKVSFYVPRGE